MKPLGHVEERFTEYGNEWFVVSFISDQLSTIEVMMITPDHTTERVISGHNLQTCLRAAVRFVANLTLLPDNFTFFTL